MQKPARQALLNLFLIVLFQVPQGQAWKRELVLGMGVMPTSLNGSPEDSIKALLQINAPKTFKGAAKPRGL